MRCCPDRQVDFGDIFATLSWQQNVEMVSKKAKRVFQEVDNLSQGKELAHTRAARPWAGSGAPMSIPRPRHVVKFPHPSGVHGIQSTLHP